MKTTNALLGIISVLLFWLCLNTTPTATANKRWEDVNVAAVGGDAIYDGKIPTK